MRCVPASTRIAVPCIRRASQGGLHQPHAGPSAYSTLSTRCFLKRAEVLVPHIQMVDCITQGSTLRRTLVRPYASLHDTGNSWYALGSMPAREREGGEAHPGVIELLHGNVGLCLESPKRRSGRQLALGQQPRNLRAGTPPYARHRTAEFSVPSWIGSEVEERTIQGCEMWRCFQGELLVCAGRRQPSAPD